MIRIAIYHQEEGVRQKLQKSIAMILKNLEVYGKVYSIKDIECFSNGYISGRYQFEILFIDTSSKEAISIIQRRKSRNTEIVLMDTLVDDLAEFMKYKPIAWIRTSTIESAKLQEIINNCVMYIQERRESAFCIRTKSKSLRIPYRQILYMESKQHNVIVHTLQQMESVSFAATLDEVEKVLPQDRFMRCHQSYLVNNENIQQLDRRKRNLTMINGSIVNISKKHYPTIDEFFMRESVI